VHPEPIGTIGLLAMAAGFALFLISLLFAGARGEKADKPQSQTKAGSSWIGVLVQMLAFLCVGFGPMRIAYAPDTAPALIEGVLVAALMLLTIGLFLSASRTMGKNWAIVARTRSDHQLVTTGPFARIRHPIYTALFAFMLAMALAFGHWRGLILGVPLYWLGTWIRIRQEERLLRAQFGADYDAYAARVKRFVPGVI
jgi:protein-S-isoprenylcysteine O-methyltransferase Ste14